MFILSSITGGLECCSVNNTSVCGISELNVFKYLKFLGEIFDQTIN